MNYLLRVRFRSTDPQSPYIAHGGHALFSFKSAFSDENMQVRTCLQPGIISQSIGTEYQLFVAAYNTRLCSEQSTIDAQNCAIRDWMELY